MNNIKVLHRIYFGFDGKPDMYQEYLKTWEEQLPEYTIMHWNADNLPIDINEYTKKMYELKDHAFLSDFFRWWILKEHGGIYLDADIEVVNGEYFNTLVEELEQSNDYEAFFGVEMYSGGYTAHSMASKKNSEISQFMCKLYEDLGTSSLFLWRKNEFVAPRLLHLYLHYKGFHIKQQGFKDVTEPTITANVKIYPKEYFAPLSYGNTFWLESPSNKHTCLCHHYSVSWVEDDSAYKAKKESFSKRLIMYTDYLNKNHSNSLKTKLLKIVRKKDLYLALVDISNNNNIIHFIRFTLKTLKDALRLIKVTLLLIIRKEQK